MYFQNHLGVKDIQRRLGQRIRELRIKQGFDSQDAFSDFLGLHRTVIGFWETGRKDLRLSTLVRVSEALGVTLSELFAGLEDDGASVVPKPRSLAQQRIRRELTALEDQMNRLKAAVLNDPSGEARPGNPLQAHGGPKPPTKKK